jgi:hypothetical protein
MSSAEEQDGENLPLNAPSTEGSQENVGQSFRFRSRIGDRPTLTAAPSSGSSIELFDGMRHLLHDLATSGDIPDDAWMSVGLSPTISQAQPGDSSSTRLSGLSSWFTDEPNTDRTERERL